MSDIKLNADNELQVQAYLRFAKLKRDQHVREAISVITGFKDERLSPGEMYNYKDMKEMLEDMSAEMKALVDKEIQHAYHTNALVVKILLFQAQVHGMDFQVDTNALEDEFLLKTIMASEVTALSRPATDFVARRNTALGKIGINITNVGDPNAAKERDAMGSELEVTKDRMAKLQAETTKMMREKTALNEQINALQDQLAEKDSVIRQHEESRSKVAADFSSLSMNAKGAAQASESQFDEMRKQLNEARGQLEDMRRKYQTAQEAANAKDKEVKAARDELDGHVKDSKQYQQLQQMLKKKNDEVITLRKSLHKYEPQNIPNAD